MRFFTGVIVFTLSGCASLRYDRIRSYEALPLPFESFQLLDQYTASIMPKPFNLHVSERGSAWLLMIRRRDGVVAQTVAVTYRARNPSDGCATPTFGSLLAVLPGDPSLYDGARGILVAHDGARCYGKSPYPFACAHADVWNRAMELPRAAVTDRTRDATDAVIRGWYEAMLQTPPVRERNTTLSAEGLDALESEESVMADLVRAAPAPLGAGIAAGILSTPVGGIVVAGVAYAVSLPQHLFARTAGPEYGDAPMSAGHAADQAEYFRLCAVRDAPSALSVAQDE